MVELGIMNEKILNRKLTQQEEDLVIWLIKNGQNSYDSFLEQVNDLRIVAYCKCGCASIDFKIIKTGFNVISDFLYRDENENLMGIFLFEVNNELAGLDLYAIEAEYVPTRIPKTSWLFSEKDQELHLRKE